MKNLRLLNGDKANAAAIAKYITEHYPSLLACFAIGNEPDWRSYQNKDPKITDYPSYLTRWRDFAAAVLEAAPGARIAGPDTGSNFPVPHARSTEYNGKSWTRRFADDEAGAGILTAVFQHDYTGQSAKGVSVQTAIDDMLSRKWLDTHYPGLYENVLSPAMTAGLRYRMTECNDYTGGVDGASNAFASALWALDYMHWHAARRAAGVNFHNKRWICTDTIYLDRARNLKINSKAFGLKAFDLGGHGSIESVAIANPDGVNLTAYAVCESGNHFVTLINKEHGSGARAANVTVALPGQVRGSTVIFLAAPSGDVAAKTGVTLGGAEIGANGLWRGTWGLLPPGQTGYCAVKVPAASAAVVRIPAQ